MVCQAGGGVERLTVDFNFDQLGNWLMDTRSGYRLQDLCGYGLRRLASRFLWTG